MTNEQEQELLESLKRIAHWQSWVIEHLKEIADSVSKLAALQAEQSHHHSD
jgi:hypothetical protein